MRQNTMAVIGFILILITGFFSPILASAATTIPVESIRTANFFLKWDLSEFEARELAKNSVVILDMEIQNRRPDLLRKIKLWNPKIKLLVYITPQEIRQDAANSYTPLRKKLVEGVDPSWYLYSSRDQKLTWWPGTYLLNVSLEAPRVAGRLWNDYLVDFVSQTLLSSGYWDGVFYDNAWDSVTHFAGSDIDLNYDGLVDSDLDRKWQAGMKYIYNQTRIRAPQAIIVGNGTTRVYTDELNGMVLENFLPSAWESTMNTYRFDNLHTQKPGLNIINANTANTGIQSGQAVRFGLGSALLEDGYFSYDFGDKDHGQTWWYDEYAARLGAPTAVAESRNKFATYKKDVWRRDFEHGLTVVNSTSETATIDLGADYEKINGTVDRTINDGSIISEVEIAPNDGLLLLKTSQQIENILFPNGSFARFLRSDGSRARNGFFVFEEKYKGNTGLARVDLDDNGKLDVIVVEKNKISAWRDDGQPFFKIYPYTADYSGNLVIAFGDLDTDGVFEFYIAPEKGAHPVKIYNLVGEEIMPIWYPFGKKYTGGYSLAIAGKGPGGRIIIGSGQGRPATVSMYNAGLAKMLEWPVSKNYNSNGVTVGAGDLNGDGVAEIIAGFGAGSRPTLNFFTLEGTVFAKPISFTGLNFYSAKIQTTDIDFNGSDEIVLLTSGGL